MLKCIRAAIDSSYCTYIYQRIVLGRSATSTQHQDQQQQLRMHCWEQPHWRSISISISNRLAACLHVEIACACIHPTAAAKVGTGLQQQHD
jgi:hypothetical protein